MEILSFIIPFIVLLTVVVFIHEYGHYYFAKLYGVGVTDFSIGFGKEIFGFNDKSGTRWKFCAIPLGGYVKFFGDRNVFSQAEQNELLKQYSKEDYVGDQEWNILLAQKRFWEEEEGKEVVMEEVEMSKDDEEEDGDGGHWKDE